MDSFSTHTIITKNDDDDNNSNDDEEPSTGLLRVFVHSARDIHNICIYADQDVYAKLSLTCTPDDVVSTRVATAGGRNPRFDEQLHLKVTRSHAVLKCELWMMSRAKCYLDDQLLAFTLVPLSSVVDGELTEDFALSSTDLFHSPAGTVRLTLSLDAPAGRERPVHGPSISSEVVMFRKMVDYNAVEFKDVTASSENLRMVSQYLGMGRVSDQNCEKMEDYNSVEFKDIDASSENLRMVSQYLGMGRVCDPDCDMGVNSCGTNEGVVSAVFSASTTTSVSDERASAESVERETPTSKEGSSGESDVVSKQNVSVFGANVEAEQMQKQIVEMYMKSMQQFSDSLAKMKLPMGLEGGPAQETVVQSESSSSESKKMVKKEGGRVFYGSRAFF